MRLVMRSPPGDSVAAAPAATRAAWVGASGTCGGPARGELLAQHRHDLLAEQVELLEHGLQRQPGVVDQEQLALVVADVLAEAERPLDDLLAASRRSAASAR